MRRITTCSKAPGRPWLLVVLCLCWCTASPRAAELAVHGVEGAAALRAPLERLLRGTATTVAWRAAPLAHWLALREAGDAGAALESPHFAGWRLRHRDWRLLAVSEVAVAYSVVARRGVTLVEVDDLAGLSVAVPPPPSLPALQLLAVFRDPLTAPRLRATAGETEGLALLRAGEVDAAVVPERVSRGLPDLQELLTLEELPAAVLTVGPEADPALAEALLAVVTDARAPAALRALRLRPATLEAAEALLRRARLLAGTWGAEPESTPPPR